MKYKEFYDGFKDNITGNEYKALMLPIRVVAEILDLQKKYSVEINGYKFYREFIESIIEHINNYRELTDKQKITVYYIKKCIEDEKARVQSRRDARFYSYDEESEYTPTVEKQYKYESHECNGNCGGCMGYGTCDLGDEIMWEQENSGGI